MNLSKFLLLITAVSAIGMSDSKAQVLYQTFNGPGGATEPTGVYQNEIVGLYASSSTSFLYNGSSFTPIVDPLATGGTFAIGVSGGTVVGFYSNGSIPVYTGFTYNGTSYSSFSYPLSMDTFTSGIDGTNIVGEYSDSYGHTHGFLDSDGTFTSLDYPGTTDGTEVLGISGNTIVGQYLGGSFIYSNGVYTNINDPLSTGGTYADGISGNDVIGYYDENGNDHGFLYNGSTYINIDDPLVTSSGLNGTYPAGISGNTIVGTFVSNGGATVQGFIATVPEPNSVALALLGLSLIALTHLRRRLSCLVE